MWIEVKWYDASAYRKLIGNRRENINFFEISNIFILLFYEWNVSETNENRTTSGAQEKKVHNLSLWAWFNFPVFLIANDSFPNSCFYYFYDGKGKKWKMRNTRNECLRLFCAEDWKCTQLNFMKIMQSNFRALFSPFPSLIHFSLLTRKVEIKV